MKPAVTFDLDDVLCEVTRTFVPWHNEKYGTELMFEEILGDNLHELLGVSKEVEFDRWLEYFASPDYMETPADPETVMVLERLKEEFRIVIVSARNIKFQPFAKPWLDKHMTDLIDEIHFIKHPDGSRRTKGEIAKEVGSVLHIDDEPRHYASCHMNGIPFVFFTAPWNTEETKSDGRVNTMSDIYKYLPLE